MYKNNITALFLCWVGTDLCEANIVVPLSNDRNTLIEQTYKSTKFPYERTNPLVCTWNVKVILVSIDLFIFNYEY